MNQKLFIGLISSFVIVVILFLYFYFFTVNNNKPQAIDVVPSSASIIFETQNIESAIQNIKEKNFFKQFNNAEKLQHFSTELFLLDSILNTDKNFNEWKQSKKTVLSFHTDISKNLHIFLAIEINEDIDVIEAFSWLNISFPNRFKITKRLYNKEIIYDFIDFKGLNNFSIAIKRGILMFSFDGSLIEEGLIKCKYFNSYNNTELKKLNFVKTISSEINVYVNYKNVSCFFNSFMNDSSSQNFNFISSVANWTGGNLQINDNSLIVNGASITDDSIFQFIDIFSEQIPSSQNITDKLPQTTNFYFSQNISNKVKYQKNLVEYYISENQLNNYTKYNDSIEQNLNIKFNQGLVPSLGNNYILANINANGMSFDSSWIGVFSPQNLNEFINAAKFIEAKIKFSNNDTLDSSQQASSKFNFFPIGNALKFYCAGFEKLNIKYYCIYNGLVIFASNTYVLNHYLEKLVESNTLQSLESYKDAKSLLSNQNSIELMVINKNTLNLVNNFANSSFISSVSINKGYYKKAEIFAMQFTHQSEKTFSTQLLVQFNKSENNVTELVWEASIDTTIITKPYIVNNSNTNEQVVIVQDANNSLYCFDKEGKQLWKEKINSKMVSGISQLDIFNNGTTQYLFNTSNQIYLLDANGKNLQNYPIWIPAATNYPLSLFDFNSDRSYQIFIAGKYYKIWQYDSKGMLQAGFNPKEIWPNSIQPIHGFTLANEHLVYNLNENGILGFYLNNGKAINSIKLDSTLKYKFVNHIQTDTGTIRFFCLDSSNTLLICDIVSNGTIKQQTKYIIKPNTYFDLLINQNIGQVKIVIRTNVGYEIFDNKLQSNLSYVWSDSSSTNFPEIINLGGKEVYVYLSSMNCELILTEKNNKPHSSFKFIGCKHFGLGNLFGDEDIYLASGSNENKLFIYRLK